MRPSLAIVLPVAVLALTTAFPLSAHADTLSAYQTNQLVNAATNALSGTSSSGTTAQNLVNQYNPYSGYQTREQISQGLQRNIVSNISQIPQQPHISSRVTSYSGALVNGNMPNVQQDAQNEVAGQVRAITNQNLPHGISIDPYQLMQQK